MFTFALGFAAGCAAMRFKDGLKTFFGRKAKEVDEVLTKGC